MKFTHGKVFVHDVFAGVIEKQDQYIFTYDENYLKSSNPIAASLTLPLRSKPYQSKTLFPFFDGLIPEGWLLELSAKTWKIKPQDRWTLLLSVCTDCIGAVHVIGAEGKV